MSTEEQREDISGRLHAASTWLEDEGFGATTVVRDLPGHGGPDGKGRRAGVRGYNGGCRAGSRADMSSPQPPALSLPHIHQMLKEKLAELRKLCQGLFFRVEERKKWPERLSALDNLLNHSSMFLT